MSDRLAVLCVSLILTLGLFMLAWWLMRTRPVRLRALIAILLWVAFIWLSPQIYYTLYVFILDGLIWQNVIQWPPAPEFLFSILAFTERPNLSFLGQALLGWGLLALALWPLRYGWRVK